MVSTTGKYLYYSIYEYLFRNSNQYSVNGECYFICVSISKTLYYYVLRMEAFTAFETEILDMDC